MWVYVRENCVEKVNTLIYTIISTPLGPRNIPMEIYCKIIISSVKKTKSSRENKLSFTVVEFSFVFTRIYRHNSTALNGIVIFVTVEIPFLHFTDAREKILNTQSSHGWEHQNCFFFLNKTKNHQFNVIVTWRFDFQVELCVFDNVNHWNNIQSGVEFRCCQT